MWLSDGLTCVSVPDLFFVDSYCDAKSLSRNVLWD